MLHLYFSRLGGYPDFQKNSILHFPRTTGDFAMSSAIKVPACGCLLVPSIMLVHGMDLTVTAVICFGFFFPFCFEREGWLMKPH